MRILITRDYNRHYLTRDLSPQQVANFVDCIEGMREVNRDPYNAKITYTDDDNVFEFQLIDSGNKCMPDNGLADEVHSSLDQQRREARKQKGIPK
jgi:hypothetical protein